MLKISIPTPCHEDWNAMIPNAQGKHCNACAKTVVDFTSMTDDEVKHFLLNRKSEKLCGRFRNEQLHRITINLPHNIFYIPMPLWKKYLAAILIVFSTTLFSCDTHLKGEPIIKEESAVLGGAMAIINTKDTLPTDTSNFIVLPHPLPPPPPTTGVMYIVPTEIQGNIAIKPIEPLVEQGIIAIVDTPKIEEKYNKVGEVLFIEKDSASIKNNKSKDSANCNKKIFL
ncbi:MAG: hypothetical protein KA319_02475 [Ferruginibacter sp.]|nr:hypothetical protein [Ferruginibacter sp.]